MLKLAPGGEEAGGELHAQEDDVMHRAATEFPPAKAAQMLGAEMAMAGEPVEPRAGVGQFRSAAGNLALKDEQGFSTGDETPWMTLPLVENATETVSFDSMNSKARKYTIRVKQVH